MSGRKKILYQSDFSLLKTGFGRASKTVLSYLYKTGKYDIVHYCAGTSVNSPELSRTPWKSIGCLPDNQRDILEINKDPHVQRQAQYGSYYLDSVIKQERPDIYIAAQDIWGVDFSISKKWFNKINSVIWTTLDSLPILPSATEAARKVKNFWIWSSFATDELNNMGFDHVKTFHGPIDHESFYKLKDSERKELREKFDIPEDTFVIGFVFRNQLRKSVPNLLEGFKLFKENNPDAKAKLLLHTHFGEGWNILRLAGEYGLSAEDIITTYACGNCGSYEVKNFSGQKIACSHCGHPQSQETTNVQLGVSEKQLNEVYNLMDVYCHPFTSGGQEIPIQEAKFTELITLVTNYSCGQEMCAKEAHSLPLEWSEYREANTEFIKASTCPKSIAQQLQKVLQMPAKKKSKMGSKAREWVVKNYSMKALGPVLEKFLDNCEPITNYSFQEQEELRDPNYQIPIIQDDGEWVLHLYHNILKAPTVDKDNDGFKYWMKEIENGTSREQIESYFRKTAIAENEKITTTDIADFLDDDEGKRILYVMPESIGDVFLSTSLFNSLKNNYPDYNLYVATKENNFEILEGNENVYKVIPYIPEMDNLPWLEGVGDHRGYFEIAFLPYVGTQRTLDYLHNGKDKIAFDIKY
jgi:glycosyltransferase involved in cell wall biosynthesis